MIELDAPGPPPVLEPDVVPPPPAPPPPPPTNGEVCVPPAPSYPCLGVVAGVLPEDPEPGIKEPDHPRTEPPVPLPFGAAVDGP